MGLDEMFGGFPRPVLCVGCHVRPIEAPSFLYCATCKPSLKPPVDPAEEAYYDANPDKRPSIYADDPGSGGGI